MSTPEKICNDGASKSNDDGVCEVVDMLHNMSTDDDNKDNDEVLDICANCGKEGSGVNNTCNKCKSVKYCNAACKKKHRSKHKKKCDRRVAELHDEALFRQPFHEKDCPICFLKLPTLGSGSRYKSCCGKMICSGCIHAVRMRDGNVGLCPFCRIPTHNTVKEMIEREKKRVEAGDAEAIYQIGVCFDRGLYSFPQDYSKAVELFYRAGELGHAAAYLSIGSAYYNGRGVEKDEKKATHYYEIAAMRGDEFARYNLGCIELRAGNIDKALRHFVIATSCGYSDSLALIPDKYTLIEESGQPE